MRARSGRCRLQVDEAHDRCGQRFSAAGGDEHLGLRIERQIVETLCMDCDGAAQFDTAARGGYWLGPSISASPRRRGWCVAILIRNPCPRLIAPCSTASAT